MKQDQRTNFFSLDKAKHLHLVGIKGVGMTSLAQILLDAELKISGCDLEEDFVTQSILDKLNIPIITNFDHQLEKDVDCVIYTAAHNAQHNPIVLQAKKRNITTLSLAQALAFFANQKKTAAVCGVGGKTTTSSMLAWVFEYLKLPISYSSGVGQISTLEKTGSWSNKSPYFITEADEYVVNPDARVRKEKIIPRFSFLKPFVTICTNLKFDHPDVYVDFTHTKKVFLDFFKNTQQNGYLIINADDSHLVALTKNLKEKNARSDLKILDFAKQKNATLKIINHNNNQDSKNHKNFFYSDFVDTRTNTSYSIRLKMPGIHNLKNALACILACEIMGVSIKKSILALEKFNNLGRRFEFIGQKNHTLYYDDYAHHPSEIANSIQTIKEMYPDKKITIIFQPHTYSRTKALFHDFVLSLSQADNLILLDIFGSAREKKDETISSKLLADAIYKLNPICKPMIFTSIKQFATYFKQSRTHDKTSLSDEVVMTMGAGDVYQIHDLIQ